MKDYYKILNISPSATLEEIKSAFNQLALKSHPDKGGTKEWFREVHEAYYVLKDSDRRSAYDKASSQAEPNLSVFLSGFEEAFQNEHPELMKTMLAAVSRMFAADRKYESTPLTEWDDFYIVGNPIVVKNPVENFSPVEAKSFLRSDISQEELENAFPASGNVLLFLQELDALKYALSINQRTIYENTEYAISPVFKVAYLGDKQELESSYMGVSYVHSSPVDHGNHNSYSRVRHSNADVSKLELLSGFLRVSYLGVSKEYPRVEFNPALTAENQSVLMLS